MAAELTNNRTDPHKFIYALENSSNAPKCGLRTRLRACLHGGGRLQVGQVTDG